MIITTMYGERLKLTATRLTELDHHDSMYPFYADKVDLKTALDRLASRNNFGFKTILVRGRESGGGVHNIHVVFSPGEGRIGCKYFDSRTFNLILCTMGLKKKAVAKKKAKGGKR
jgi:hypothetical protein